MSKQKKLTIEIELGDILYIGRFKNKKIVVKEIGSDVSGQPTINGSTILKGKVAKLMPITEK